MSFDGRAKERLIYLDAIRGIAALTVLVHHYCTAYGYPYAHTILTRTPANIWRDGPAAVSMFFVLSGLVLSLTFFGEPAKKIYDLRLFDWTIARVARIWLPFAAVLMLSAVLHEIWIPAFVTIPARHPALLQVNWAEPVHALDLVKQLNLFSGYWQKLVPQAWTLQLELVISLLVPPAAILANRRMSWLLFVVFLLIAGLRAPLYLAHFCGGVALARALRTVRERIQPVKYLSLAIGLVGICLYSSRTWLPGNAYDHAPSALGWYVNGAGATAILLCALTSPPIQTFLSRRPLVWLGRVSYSIYLWHWAALVCVAPLFLLVADKVVGTKPTLCWWFGLLGTMTSVLAVSALSFRFIEVPSISLGRALRKLLSQRRGHPI
jgi:peptidoglycan/LPS O-acetylase OafA/YrhL